ncbi:YceI family protein [Polaromonas sp. P1-6]|nr:YceI family protein [Polaromonas sp. P1-6]
MDPAGSHIRFTSRQMGVPVDGAFRKFDASLAFDPKRRPRPRDSCALTCPAWIPASGRSTRRWWARSGSMSGAIPTRFEMHQIQSQGAGRFQVSGVLSLKGVSQPLVLNAVLKASGNQAAMEGSFVIKRLDFGIGGGLG